MFAVIRVSDGGRERLFPTGQAAGELAKAWNEMGKRHGLPERYRVVKLNEEETADLEWHAREEGRFVDGSYKPLPWCYKSFAKPEHFAHVSTDDPEKIAFTPDAEHGRADRQVRMRPGRYLALLGLENGDVKRWCAAYAAAYLPIEIKFAETADDIERAYVNGPASCMAWFGAHNGDKRPDCEIGDDWGYESSCHPVRVYAAGDLSVAYLGDLSESGGVRERCLVWQSRKRRSRAYPEDSRIGPALDAMGYRCIEHRLGGEPRLSFEGARLARIEESDCLVLPYIDGDHGVEDYGYGSELRISPCGDLVASEVNGLVEMENRPTCDSCGRRIDEGDECCSENGETYCANCYGDCYFSCEACSCETSHDDCMTDERGRDYCADCYNDRYTHCAECDEELRRDRAHEHDGDDYCADCLPEPDEDTPDEPSPTIADPNQQELPL